MIGEHLRLRTPRRSSKTDKAQPMISITQFAHEMSTETMDERESFTNRKQWLPENFTSLVESFMVYRTTDQFCSSTEAAPLAAFRIWRLGNKLHFSAFRRDTSIASRRHNLGQECLSQEKDCSEESLEAKR